MSIDNSDAYYVNLPENEGKQVMPPLCHFCSPPRKAKRKIGEYWICESCLAEGYW